MILNATGATEATAQSILADMEALTLFRRIVKLMESQAAVDAANRQRISVDTISAGLTLTTVGTVAAVTTVTNQTALAGMDREMYINQARVAYSTGIRAKLT